MGVVAVIPARGGSKGIPRKNLVSVAGQPLIAYSIKAALEAKSIDRVFVSTDDDEIAEKARELGAEVPFLRPGGLADDAAPMIGVLQHSLGWLETNGYPVDALVLLQPTSPLRRAHHIDEAMSLFQPDMTSSVVSVVEVPHHFNPVSVMKLSEDGILSPFLGEKVTVTRRQDKPKVFARNGPAVLICHPDTLRSGELYGDRCVPYVMSETDSLDIDSHQDLALAHQALLARGW